MTTGIARFGCSAIFALIYFAACGYWIITKCPLMFVSIIFASLACGLTVTKATTFRLSHGTTRSEAGVTGDGPIFDSTFDDQLFDATRDSRERTDARTV